MASLSRSSFLRRLPSLNACVDEPVPLRPIGLLSPIVISILSCSTASCRHLQRSRSKLGPIRRTEPATCQQCSATLSSLGIASMREAYSASRDSSSQKRWWKYLLSEHSCIDHSSTSVVFLTSAASVSDAASSVRDAAKGPESSSLQSGETSIIVVPAQAHIISEAKRNCQYHSRHAGQFSTGFSCNIM